MQEIESAVRDLGGSAMQGIDHAVKGLNSGTLEGTLPFIIGVLILVVVLLLFGGKRIPELAKALGKASYEYKKAKEALENEAASFKETIEKSIEQENDDKKNNK